MAIDEILKEATVEETETAVMNSPFERLARGGYKLFFGAPIGERRNQYWLSPLGDYFVFDYLNNLSIVEDSLTVLSMQKASAQSIDKKQRRDRQIMTALSHLNGSLTENLTVYGKIDLEGSVLSISNREIYNILTELRRRAFELNSTPIGTLEFASKVEEIVDFYKGITF